MSDACVFSVGVKQVCLHSEGIERASQNYEDVMKSTEEMLHSMLLPFPKHMTRDVSIDGEVSRKKK